MKKLLIIASLLASPTYAADANFAAGFYSCNSCWSGAQTSVGLTNGVNTSLLNAMGRARRDGTPINAVYPGGNRSLRPVGYIIGRSYYRVNTSYVGLMGAPEVPTGAVYDNGPK